MGDSGGFGAPPPPPPPGEGGGSGGSFSPKGIGDILSEAFNLYTKNAAQLIQLVAMVVVPLTLVQAFLVRVAFKPCKARTIESLQDLGELLDSCSGGFFRSLMMMALASLISALIGQLLLGALTRGGAATLVGRPIDVTGSYKYAFSRLGGLIGLSLLVAVVVFVGFLLLFIPGVIFAVFLSMAVPAFIVERKGATDAMSRSWNLVSGSWWHVLATIVVAGILAGIVSGILTSIGGSTFIGYWLLSTVAQMITAPFVALVTVVLYVDLRARTEGLTATALGAELDAAQA